MRENKKLKHIAIFLAAASIPFLLGCGRSQPPSQNIPPVVGGVPGSVPVGPVCIPLANGSVIGFTGTHAHFLQPYVAGELAAGQIPPNSYNVPFTRFAGQSYGQVLIQPGGPMVLGGGMIYNGTAFNEFGFPEGQLTVQVTPIQQSGGGNGCYGGICGGGLTSSYNPYTSDQANITGTFQVTQINSGSSPQGPLGCVSGLAMAMNLRGNAFYMSTLYLYLNNTNHGIWFNVRSY